MARILVIPSTC